MNIYKPFYLVFVDSLHQNNIFFEIIS